MYGPSSFRFGESSEIEKDLHTYVDHVAAGIAKVIDTKTMLVDGTSVPARATNLLH